MGQLRHLKNTTSCIIREARRFRVKEFTYPLECLAHMAQFVVTVHHGELRSRKIYHLSPEKMGLGTSEL